MAYATPMGTELELTQHHCTDILYAEFHTLQSRTWELRMEVYLSPKVESMAVTTRIFTTLMPARQLFLKNSAEFHENPVNRSNADTKLHSGRILGQTYRRTFRRLYGHGHHTIPSYFRSK